jgi:transposase-like protein
MDVTFERQKMKRPKQADTIEFKELAVKRIKDGIKDGQRVSTVCKELGLSDQILRNWVKAAAEGQLNGAGGRVVTPEERDLSRLRAENLRLKRENELLKQRRRTSQGRFCEGCLDCRAGQQGILVVQNVRSAGRQDQWLPDMEARRSTGSQARGFSASKERVERLMRDHGIRARSKRRDQVTTDSKHGLPVAENLLARNFTPTVPNPVWTSDMTYLWTDRTATHAEIKATTFDKSRFSTTGNGSIQPSDTSRPFSSWRTGSASSIRKNWSHEIHPLADETPGEPHRP